MHVRNMDWIILSSYIYKCHFISIYISMGRREPYPGDQQPNPGDEEHEGEAMIIFNLLVGIQFVLVKVFRSKSISNLY